MTMWIGWVKSKFRNPIVKVWANFDNPFKKLIILQSFVWISPSIDGNSARIKWYKRTTFYKYVHRFSQFLMFLGYQYTSWSSAIVNACILILALTYPSIRVEVRCIFHKEVKILWNLCTVLLGSCTVVTSQIFSRVPPERATYEKLITNFKNSSSWLDYLNLSKRVLLGF